jgi:hypothetical protein
LEYHIFDTPAFPTEFISVDIIGKIKSRNKTQYIVVVVDQFNQYVWGQSFVNCPTANQIGEYIFSDIKDSRWDIKKVLPHRASLFMSKPCKCMCFKNGCKLLGTSTYYPECDGIPERANLI